MKYLLRVLFILALFCGVTSHARADGLDFHMSVLDPTNIQALDITDPTIPFDVTFGPCPNFIDGVANTADGCFAGYNDTNLTFTSLSLIFTNSTNPKDPDNFVDYLNGQDATCDTDTHGSLFGSASCNLVGSDYVLDFTGGIGIAPGAIFFITETGPTPEAFGTGTGMVGTTPEPDSLLLLSTGVMMTSAGLYLTKRRRVAVVAKK